MTKRNVESDLAIIALRGFEDRAANVDNYIMKEKGSDKSFLLNIKTPRFQNGEAKAKLIDSVRGKDVYIIQDIGNYSCTYKMYNYENHMSPDDHYQDIKRTLSAIAGKAKRITLVMTLLYGARQHRKNSRESLDCALAIQELQRLGVSNILTIDAHDPDIQNAIPCNSFDSLCPSYQFLKAFVETEKTVIDKNNTVIISPDTGAMDRSIVYANIFGVNLGLFYKRRDYSTIINGKNPIIQHEYLGTPVKGKNIIIVDDMISSGESVLDIAERMKEMGVKNVYVFTSFAFFTDGFDKFDKYFNDKKITKIFGTNASHISEELRNKPWFKEVDITKLLAKIISKTNNNESISQILDSSEKIKKLLEDNKHLINV